MNSTWKAELQKKLSSTLGAKKGAELYAKYENAFNTSYYEECTPDVAVSDISQIEKLSKDRPVDIAFDLLSENNLHLRLFQLDKTIPLSDVLPMLENLDLKTLDEHPYKVTTQDTTVWISDFNVTYSRGSVLDIPKVKDIFQEAFINTNSGIVENDGFNKLVLGAELSWREIIILRAYAKYLKQAGFRFSQYYLEQTLANNPQITKDLIELFIKRFDPKSKAKTTDDIVEKITKALESVSSLDEDRILRRFLELINATLRTNYFQVDEKGQPKSYLSVKLSSRDVPELPLPVPLYEIFVYSPRFEGIHLRNSKVARGGIRWSDRREDFRTEILGLMKAQKVKNAVIVPSGAKGGFVLKMVPANATREQLQTEVVQCYKSFIRGLLDLTDNLKNAKAVRPPNVECYDEDDTYLVVAADKGTASFSDTANGISKEYDFWLGDAFASGGSVGYDHKKMGITARGAWESVKRHFHEIGVNAMTTPFTVAGIGDMSGDVFGNGMIYTPNIKLIAGFDHRDIFLDPDPDAKATFDERVRLFNLPTSSWQDFNPALISKGGGIFKRSSKAIALSPEIQQALGTDAKSLTPNELIRTILKAPVDLLWNGGIGTYIKSSTESHADVGDKTNEYCRVNGNELRCKIVGEGGNLGVSQLGRIEYSLNGGLINTDFIDNSAGVDCSDREVNIKILLNPEVAKGRITEQVRNETLASMTQEVAELVLRDNYQQALVMSFATYTSPQLISLHTTYLKELETNNIINRDVEYLPDDKKLLERKASGLGLTRPELAVMMAYTKIHIKAAILASDIPDHHFLGQVADTAFPPSLKAKYSSEIDQHPLHREIVATQLSNQIVNEAGIAFVYGLESETGATIPEIVRAYIVTSRIFKASELQHLIESLDFKFPLSAQYDMLTHIRRLVFLGTRWFLRHKILNDDNMPPLIEHYTKGVEQLSTVIPTLMGGSTKNYLETLSKEFEQEGVSHEMALRIAAARAMYTSLNIIEVATKNHFDLDKTARIYFSVGEYFNLLWFRDRIASDAREGYWDSLARLTLRDELDVLQKLITVSVMKHSKNGNDPQEYIASWIEKYHRPMERWEKVLEMLHSSTSVDYVMFFIALRELSDLIHASEIAA